MKKWMQTGGGGVVNFYYGIPRVWKDNAIWKFRRQGEGGGGGLNMEGIVV